MSANLVELGDVGKEGEDLDLLRDEIDEDLAVERHVRPESRTICSCIDSKIELT